MCILVYRYFFIFGVNIWQCVCVRVCVTIRKRQRLCVYILMLSHIDYIIYWNSVIKIRINRSKPEPIFIYIHFTWNVCARNALRENRYISYTQTNKYTHRFWLAHVHCTCMRICHIFMTRFVISFFFFFSLRLSCWASTHSTTIVTHTHIYHTIQFWIKMREIFVQSVNLRRPNAHAC